MASNLYWVGDIFPPADQRSFDIELWDGTVLAPADAPRHDARLIFRRKSTFKKILFSRSAFVAGKAYVNGDIDIIGDIALIFREIAPWGKTVPLPAGKKFLWGLKLLVL